MLRPQAAAAGDVAGLIDVGLLARAEEGTAILTDDVRYSLRLTASNDVIPY